MTSSDVRDVLNLPDGPVGPRPPKKQKTSAPRPNLKGLAREVQNLGGDNPIAIVPEVSVFKKRRLASRKPAARWELRPFGNSARDDGSLILRHWRRKPEAQQQPAPEPAPAPPSAADGGEQDAEDGAASSAPAADARPAAETLAEDSTFAKYNVQVSVPQYSEDQYQANLQSPNWTKEETDYLLELVRDFDLRWSLIWDRYDFAPRAVNGEAAADGDETKAVIPAPKPRSMEDLKARYYEVAAKMMAVQKPVQYMTQPEYALHELMANFDAAQETARKQFAQNALTRSREEAKEEESLLLELKRILARQDRFNEERRELYHRLDYPHTDQDISAFKSSAGLQNLLQNLMNVDKKKRRSLLDAQGVSPSTGGPNAAGGGSAQPTPTAESANRRGSIAPLSAGGHRDSIGGSTAQTPTSAVGASAAAAGAASGNKKGAQPQERRKLSELEEYIYGVSHHDRLGSGPTFRYEKINKMFTHKSNQQQMRITNTLNELDVPPRLIMPTAAITARYEQLLAAVNTLLDARKATDKIDQDMKIELAKKAEREKTNAPAAGTETVAAAAAAAPTAEAGAEDAAKAAAPTPAEAAAGESAAADAAAEPAAADGAEAAKASVEPKEDAAAAADEVKDKPAGPTAHKRSASVLSTVSDKSAKRQKK